jgi:hypothetical protein
LRICWQVTSSRAAAIMSVVPQSCFVALTCQGNVASHPIATCSQTDNRIVSRLVSSVGLYMKLKSVRSQSLARIESQDCTLLRPKHHAQTSWRVVGPVSCLAVSKETSGSGKHSQQCCMQTHRQSNQSPLPARIYISPQVLHLHIRRFRLLSSNT